MDRLREEIGLRIYEIEQKSPRLDTPWGPFPSKGGDGGDDCLWNGLLSSVSQFSGFSQVAHCQAIEGEKRCGMWYRNPLRRSNDNEGHEWYFSRDMALGTLLHFACYSFMWMEHRANIWIDWINSNRACAVKKPGWMGGGCLIRSPMFRYSPDDDRSNITPVMWALMGRVWRFKGWPLHEYMKKYDKADGDVSIVSAMNVPLGYQLHLLAVQSYLKWMVGQSKAVRQKVSGICFQRQPDNLFYKILSQEAVLMDDIELFLERCPDPATFQPRDYWLWEKSTQDPENSCGWDWVFLGKLILSL